jgi:DNA-directed RNA polymerase specialized sigma24 family protein
MWRDPASRSTSSSTPAGGPRSWRSSPSGVELTRELLAQLKPQERRALTLKALGYSYSEIGELTGWTYTNVKRVAPT